MVKYINYLEERFSKIKNGFKEIEHTAIIDFDTNRRDYMEKLAYLCYESSLIQVRMYAVFLFGYMSDDEKIMEFMKNEVSNDESWRVQEILAKSFDFYCRKKGYENSLFVIDLWLEDENENVRRAVTEGLRIWTNRPYFKENPYEAVRRLANLRYDKSQYVRKSVGNALKDISKAYPEIIKKELLSWKLNSKEVRYVYRLAAKFTGLIVTI